MRMNEITCYEEYARFFADALKNIPRERLEASQHYNTLLASALTFMKNIGIQRKTLAGIVIDMP